MGKDELAARLERMKLQQDAGVPTPDNDFENLKAAFEKEKNATEAFVRSVDVMLAGGKPKLSIVK